MNDLLLVLFDTIVVLLVVPLFRSHWWGHVIRGRAEPGKHPPGWAKRVLYTVLMLALLCFTTYINYTNYRRLISDGSPDLQLFAVDEYMDEMAISGQTAPNSQPKPPATDDHRKLLRYLFSHAHYASDHNDLPEAIRFYETLDSGSYAGEKLLVFESGCVKNNLGVLYYEVSPNDRLQYVRAVNTLRDAMTLTAAKQPLQRFRDKIDKNYSILTTKH